MNELQRLDGDGGFFLQCTVYVLVFFSRFNKYTKNTNHEYKDKLQVVQVVMVNPYR